MTLPLRRWACRITEHHRPLALASSVLGMAGFILCTGPIRWAGRSETTALFGALASLAAYGVALGVGHLGDPWALARLELHLRPAPSRPRRPRLAVKTRRRSPSMPTRSWT